MNTGSIANTSSLAVSQNSRLDDGIFTSSEEVLDEHMNSPPPQQQQQQQQQKQTKSSGSLDGGDGDRGSILSWGDEIRPASAQAGPISRMCTGAFSRALVRLSGDVATSVSSSSSSGSDSDLVRRQSSPVFRLSTS